MDNSEKWKIFRIFSQRTVENNFDKLKQSKLSEVQKSFLIVVTRYYEDLLKITEGLANELDVIKEELSRVKVR